MSVDEDDNEMIKARQQLNDGDTVIFSGYFTPMSRQIPEVLTNPSDFFVSPSLDFTLTELFKKSKSLPPVRPQPDTSGLSKAPVRVTAKIIIKKVHNKRFINIKVTVKNISNKQITKLTAQWMVTNKTNHPAKVNGVTGAWQQGYFNQTLEPGATETEEWEHESPDGEKLQLIFPKWVTFYNGIKWKAGKY